VYTVFYVQKQHRQRALTANHTRKIIQEGITDDLLWLALSLREIRAMGDVENRAKAPSSNDSTEVKVGEADRPQWASERYWDG